MGLTEQIRAGGKLTRNLVQFVTDVVGSGSASLGSAYALINITPSLPCRLRLYDNEFSRDNLSEISRSFGDTNIQDNIALVGDFSQSVGGQSFKIDPTLYSVTENSFTYYRVDPPSEINIQATIFNLEDLSIETNNFVRRDLPIISASLEYNPNQGAIVEKGTINSLDIPTTYLLVSASLDDSAHIARLRLYSISSSLNLESEISRSFDVEASPNAFLIVDMILSGSNTTYFSPKIIGANLDTMGTDLENIRTSRELISGKKEIYYMLENKNINAVGAENIEVSLHVFSLEN